MKNIILKFLLFATLFCSNLTTPLRAMRERPHGPAEDDYSLRPEATMRVKRQLLISIRKEKHAPPRKKTRLVSEEAERPKDATHAEEKSAHSETITMSEAPVTPTIAERRLLNAFLRLSVSTDHAHESAITGEEKIPSPPAAPKHASPPRTFSTHAPAEPQVDELLDERLDEEELSQYLSMERQPEERVPDTASRPSTAIDLLPAQDDPSEDSGRHHVWAENTSDT